MFRLDSGFLPGFEEAFEPLMPETLNHTSKCNQIRYASQPLLHITYKPGDTARLYRAAFLGVSHGAGSRCSGRWRAPWTGAGRTRIFRVSEAIGVDQIAACKGHKYLTLVYQIDTHCKRLLWVGVKRTVKTLLGFLRWFGKARSQALDFICPDMWKP